MEFIEYCHMNDTDKKRLFNIGRRINDLRIEKRLSIQELADLANVERSNLSRICTKGSNFTLVTFLRIVEALQCTPEEILGSEQHD